MVIMGREAKMGRGRSQEDGGLSEERGGTLLLAESGVVVEVDLGIGAVDEALRSLREGVDLDLRAVERHKQLEQSRQLTLRLSPRPLAKRAEEGLKQMRWERGRRFSGEKGSHYNLSLSRVSADFWQTSSICKQRAQTHAPLSVRQ